MFCVLLILLFNVISIICGKCKLGEYEKPGKVFGSLWTKCHSCEDGYFCPDRKNKVRCGSGFYCDIRGVIHPQKCPRGYHCPDGIQKIPMTGPSEPIEDIKPAECPHSPIGFYCPEPNAPLSFCPEGFHCDKCDISKSDLRYHQCEPGFFCPSTETIFTEGIGAEGLRQSCIHEYFCPKDSTKIKCSPGFTCGSRGMSSPEQCRSGNYCGGYKMKKEEPCGGEFYCPYHQMSERFLCKKSCGFVSDDGKDCKSEIEYDGSIVPDFEFDCKSWVCSFFPIRFFYLMMYVGSNPMEIGTKIISKGFVLVFWTELLVVIVIAAPFFFILSLLAFIPPLLPRFVTNLGLLGGVSARMGVLFFLLGMGLLWIGTLVSSVEGINKTSNLTPHNIKVRTRQVEGDPCFNLKVKLSLTPSQHIEAESQMIKINSFQGEGQGGLYPGGRTVRLPEIRKDETVILEFYLESDSHFDLERLQEGELDISFSPISSSSSSDSQFSSQGSDCSYPLYFVSNSAPSNLKGSKESYQSLLEFKVIDVVEQYFSEILDHIGKVNIGLIGAMGVGKSTVISLMQSMLLGEVRLLKSVMNIRKHNTIEVSFFSFFENRLNFVDTFGLRDYESELLEGEDIENEDFEYQVLFVKYVMSAFVRMLHNGYFYPGFRRVLFADLVVNNTKEILNVIDVDDHIMKETKKVEEIIKILTTAGSAKNANLFPVESRGNQSMNATVYVASGSLGDSDIHEFAVIHRDYLNNKKSDHSRFFIFYKDSVCDDSVTPSYGANPQDIFRSDVYLHRKRNVFSTDLQAAVILKKFLLEIADSQGIRLNERNFRPKTCFSEEVLESYSFRRVEGGFGKVKSKRWLFFFSQGTKSLCLKMLGVGVVLFVLMYFGIYLGFCISFLKRSNQEEDEGKENGGGVEVEVVNYSQVESNSNVDTNEGGDNRSDVAVQSMNISNSENMRYNDDGIFTDESSNADEMMDLRRRNNFGGRKSEGFGNDIEGMKVLDGNETRELKKEE